MRNCANILYRSVVLLPKGGEGYVWAEKTIDHQIMLLHIALKTSSQSYGSFHSLMFSAIGFLTIFMSLNL